MTIHKFKEIFGMLYSTRLLLKANNNFSPHPYIFFNHDGETMTFLGFNIDLENGDLLDPQTGTTIEEAIIDKSLIVALSRNFVDLTEDFDTLPR